MMNANRLSSSRTPCGQAILAVPTRAFSTFKTMQLSGGCVTPQETIFFGPEYMFPSLRANYFFASPDKSNKSNLISKQYHTQGAIRQSIDPTAVMAIEKKRTNDPMPREKKCCLEKFNALFVSEPKPSNIDLKSKGEAQSSKTEQQNKLGCKKKKNNVKKRCKKRGGGNKKTKCVPVRQISECNSEDAFLIEFTSSEDKKDQRNIAKKVHFAENDNLCEVHVMNKWNFAYRAARKGPWEEMARDRDRFSKRINEADKLLGPVLKPLYREKIYDERFSKLE